MNNSALQSDTHVYSEISFRAFPSILSALSSLRMSHWLWVEDHWECCLGPMCTGGPLSLQLGLSSELVLYTLAQLTPVTACDQQQVLPILRSALTNHSPVLPETDQSGARTAVLYIWVPYGHASHRMILATFIFLELMNEFKRTQQ